MQTAAPTVKGKEYKESEKNNLAVNGQSDNIQIEMNEDTDETSNKESQKNNNEPADKTKIQTRTMKMKATRATTTEEAVRQE